jgi:hypothetical protein
MEEASHNEDSVTIREHELINKLCDALDEIDALNHRLSAMSGKLAIIEKNNRVLKTIIRQQKLAMKAATAKTRYVQSQLEHEYATSRLLEDSLRSAQQSVGDLRLEKELNDVSD